MTGGVVSFPAPFHCQWNGLLDPDLATESPWAARGLYRPKAVQQVTGERSSGSYLLWNAPRFCR
jgi:hypothetical protein